MNRREIIDILEEAMEIGKSVIPKKNVCHIHSRTRQGR